MLCLPPSLGAERQQVHCCILGVLNYDLLQQQYTWHHSFTNYKFIFLNKYTIKQSFSKWL